MRWQKIDDLAYMSYDGNADITYVTDGGYWLLETDLLSDEFFSLHEAQNAYDRYLETGSLY